jgi:hypothetical protein
MLLCFCPDSTQNLYFYRKSVKAASACLNGRRPWLGRIGANLEIEILTESYRETPHAEELAGYASSSLHCDVKNVVRASKSAFAGNRLVQDPSYWRGKRLRKFLLQVSPTTTYHAPYFWKPFPMGNKLAVECLLAQSAGLQMHLSRIR